MDKNLVGIQSALESIIMGRSAVVTETTGNKDIDEIIDLLNILSSNMSEAVEFVRNLSKGNLDVDIPGRRNYLSAPLKELHSQMNNYIWIAQQIRAGKVVDKLDFAGDFGDALNTLIETSLYGRGEGIRDNENADGEIGERSYKFHQIYLAFNHLKMMILEVDENGKIIFSNKAATRFFGECEYFNESEVRKEAASFTSGIMSILINNTDNPHMCEICDEVSNHWYKITIDRIQLPSRENVNMYIIEDINEIKQNVQALTAEATIDYLSNTANRKVGMNALERITRDSKRDKNHCVAFMDMDKLKYINDTFGHVEGDYAIKSLGNAFISSVRGSDIVSRFGGDEFLIIFNNCSLPEAEAAIMRMEEKITQLNESGIKPFLVQFSTGLMEITPEMDMSAKDIIMLLDKKMYEKKAAKAIKNAKSRKSK